MSNFPTVQEFQTMRDLGLMAVKSGFLPASINTPEKAVVIMLKGREIGIGPMEAFSKISVIQGKPTMDAELMLSQIYKRIPGAIVNFLITTNEACELEAKRPGGKMTKFSFTIADAQTAKLMAKQNWQTYPAAMLRARCISAMARAMFPDALSGVSYTPEEMGAEVDGDGGILTLPEAPKDPLKTKPPETKNPLKDLKDNAKAAAEDPGSFKITFGRLTGKLLKECQIQDLRAYMEDIVKGAESQGRTEITGKAGEFMAAATLYVSMYSEPGPGPDFEAEFEDASRDTAYDAAKAAP